MEKRLRINSSEYKIRYKRVVTFALLVFIKLETSLVSLLQRESYPALRSVLTALCLKRCNQSTMRPNKSRLRCLLHLMLGLPLLLPMRLIGRWCWFVSYSCRPAAVAGLCFALDRARFTTIGQSHLLPQSDRRVQVEARLMSVPTVMR